MYIRKVEHEILVHRSIVEWSNRANSHCNVSHTYQLCLLKTLQTLSFISFAAYPVTSYSASCATGHQDFLHMPNQNLFPLTNISASPSPASLLSPLQAAGDFCPAHPCMDSETVDSKFKLGRWKIFSDAWFISFKIACSRFILVVQKWPKSVPLDIYTMSFLFIYLSMKTLVSSVICYCE